MNIVLTITNSKRIDLLKVTLATFKKKFININLIKKIIFFDDNSSYHDRLEILKLLQDNFPNIDLELQFFHENSFSRNRHREIIKIWFDKVKSFDFCFHLEDDWECIEDFEINEDIIFLNKNSEVLGINYSWDKFTYVPPQIEIKNFENYWQWPYDERLVKKGFWFTPYFNDLELFLYPIFTLRPTLYNVKNFVNFSISDSDYNFEFYTGLGINNLKLYLTNKKKFLHIGKISAYTSNNSLR